MNIDSKINFFQDIKCPFIDLSESLRGICYIKDEDNLHNTLCNCSDYQNCPYFHKEIQEQSDD